MITISRQICAKKEIRPFDQEKIQSEPHPKLMNGLHNLEKNQWKFKLQKKTIVSKFTQGKKL